ncbi:hypothetical protein [Ruminococcus sp.]|uniref:hypothetical protein n=1 Tax=Ruminococcus sp. TaxID=41978 RepID=UPI0025E00B8D|nr:hypothetical protein [Ruminococcus sp.]
MKNSNIISITVLAVLFAGLAVWSVLFFPSHYRNKNADIILIGEEHGVKRYYNMEIEYWKDCYEKKGIRHLFLELPYYDGEFLNIWMQSDNDELLDKMLEEIQGTASDTPDYKEFFHTIKRYYPETIFHGTDIGHQYKTTGARYLEYISDMNSGDLTHSENQRIALENIEQAKTAYSVNSSEFYALREPYMISNFIREYDNIGQPKIMGIYGTYHTDLSVDRMAGALKEHYGNNISFTLLPTKCYRGWGQLPEWGISVVGIAFLLMLFIPNILWSKRQPAGYEDSAKHENKVLLTLERAGEALVSALLLTDRRLDRYSFSPRLGYIILALVLMIIYELYWIKYFRSSRTLADMYSDYCGFPLAGASLPVFATFLLGVYACNAFLIAAAIILGIGHIGIHLMHKKETEK